MMNEPANLKHLVFHAPSNEDITSSDAPANPPTTMKGPNTWAQMQKINLEVNSFLKRSFL